MIDPTEPDPVSPSDGVARRDVATSPYETYFDRPTTVAPERFRNLLRAVVSLGSNLDLDVVLHRIVEVAVELVDAQYGALGVLDASGQHLSDFLTVGIDDESRGKIGNLPEGHGILGLLIRDPRPIRLPDLNKHPDSYGFPPEHPPMTSFLGVPVFIRDEVYGNLYLTDKVGGGTFTEADEELAVALAGAAAVAVENARLHTRVRELAVLEDRERIARELHDTVIQRLFATGLSLQGASRLAQRPEVTERIEAAVDELDATVRQVRTAIFELHAARLPSASLRRELLAVSAEAAGALGFEPSMRFAGAVDAMVPDPIAPDVIAVVREGLANVARHAGASAVEIAVSVAEGRLSVIIDDDGAGPGPRRVGGRGLDNLTKRAADHDGFADLTDGPLGGSRLRWEIPLAR